MSTLISSLRSRRLLVALCVVGLAACGSDSTTPTKEATSPSSSSSKKDAGARADAGKADASKPADDEEDGTDEQTDDSKDNTPPDETIGQDAGTATPSEPDAAQQTDAGAYPWPSDCEKHYTFIAHNENGEQDKSKKKIPAGAQYYASYYYNAPWSADEVQGLRFRSIIDNKRIVHHWILYGVDSANVESGSVQGGEGQAIGSMLGEFYIAGWAPGAPDVALPDDVGLHMPTGDSAAFRLEVHYFNTAADAVEEEDASGVEFCVTSKKRTNDAAIHWMGSTNINLPAGKSTDVKSTCRPRISKGPVHLLSLSAHMHKTGVHAKAILNRSSDKSQVTLIDDPFNFSEQNAFKQPREGAGDDIEINTGDTVDVTCSYDNTTTSAIRFGENTENEMCFFYALAWPRGQLANGSFSVVPGAEPAVNCIQ